MRKQTILRKEISELNEIWKEKPFARSNCVLNVIDIALRNVNMHTFGQSKGKYGTSVKVNVDIDEYRQMFQEILEIIKKYNREWNGSGLA